MLRDDGLGGSVDTVAASVTSELKEYSYTGLTQLGNRYRFAVNASNTAGNSSSPYLSIILAAVPDRPSTGPENGDEESLSNFAISIPALSAAQNGGAPIEAYEISVKLHSGWTVLMHSLATSFSWKIGSTTNLSPGDYLPFRYRAKNVNGYSEYSPIVYL